MSAPDVRLPDGFVRFFVGGTEVVALPRVAETIRALIEDEGTLYGYGARHPRARPLAGRGVAFAVPLPDDNEHVVIRHNRHGGLLAPLTRDLFRPPTRAPHELRTAERLRAAGVPTPSIVAYAVYSAPAGFRRCDVATLEIPNSFDLSVAIMSDDAARRVAALNATAELLTALEQATARHHDLNVKNVLLERGADGSLNAFCLDVDRVVFDDADPTPENVARLLRSARKWREVYGARVTEAELSSLVSPSARR